MSHASPASRSRSWLFYALFTTLAWGIWGALIEIPERAGFPATLGYSVWALTMIPCAVAALHAVDWQWTRDARSLWLGAIVGLTGAAGQLVLFQALRTGPAYIVFPVVSLYPVLTIALSMLLLGERAARRHAIGIALALPAIALLSYTEPSDAALRGYGWLMLATIVFVRWGVPAYVLKEATRVANSETIFGCMGATAVALIPIACAMTDFDAPINWGLDGAWLAAPIHALNSLGALTLVYAMRDGKAIIVAPMTALAPVITIALSLALHDRMPLPAQTVGLVLASVAIYLMAD